jgi:hypothetical protein
MATEPREWTVPAPLRALLWWPPIALVVAMVDPDASAATIALVGLALVVLGLGVTGVSTVVGRRAAVVQDAEAVVLSETADLAVAGHQRAA